MSTLVCREYSCRINKTWDGVADVMEHDYDERFQLASDDADAGGVWADEYLNDNHHVFWYGVADVQCSKDELFEIPDVVIIQLEDGRVGRARVLSKRQDARRTGSGPDDYAYRHALYFFGAGRLEPPGPD